MLRINWCRKILQLEILPPKLKISRLKVQALGVKTQNPKQRGGSALHLRSKTSGNPKPCSLPEDVSTALNEFVKERPGKHQCWNESDNSKKSSSSNRKNANRPTRKTVEKTNLVAPRIIIMIRFKKERRNKSPLHLQ